MIAALLAVTNPGDEIIIFEPYYENYGPDALLCDANAKLVRLRPPDWTFDPDELRRAFSSKTKAIILNSPNNPTGKVFTRSELEVIANLCQEFDTLAITDEIYEHILYDGASHIPIATLPGMRERTVLVNSMSKTYSVTGWRVGFRFGCAGSDGFHPKGPRFSNGWRGGSFAAGGRGGFESTGFILRKTKCGISEAKRFFIAAVRAGWISVLSSEGRLLHHDRHQRLRLCRRCFFRSSPDRKRWRRGRAGIEFFFGSEISNSSPGSSLIRFCFCKKYETLEKAGSRLRRI